MIIVHMRKEFAMVREFELIKAIGHKQNQWQGRAVSLSDIRVWWCREFAMSTATFYRCVGKLIEHGYVTKVGHNKYVLKDIRQWDFFSDWGMA